MRRHSWLVVALGLLWASRLVAAEPSEKVPAYPPPAEVKAEFLKLLDRPKIDPAPQAISEPRHADGLITEHLSIATERKIDGSIEWMPMLIVRPEKTSGRLPAVVVLHGTGGNKEAYRGFCTQLAKRGMVAIAIDARYHGERIPGGAHGNQEYVAAITRAWRAKPGEPQEHPFYFDTCWDLWRLLDYLQTRDEIDPRRLGMYGVSMGAIEIWLAASVDDRVAVVVPAIGVQSLRWTLEDDVWQGRAGTIRGAHEAAAKDLGEPAVNGASVPRAVEQGCPGHSRPIRLPQHDSPVRGPANADPQRRDRSQQSTRRREDRLCLSGASVRGGRRERQAQDRRRSRCSSPRHRRPARRSDRLAREVAGEELIGKRRSRHSRAIGAETMPSVSSEVRIRPIPVGLLPALLYCGDERKIETRS